MTRRTVLSIKEITASGVTDTYQDFGTPLSNPCVVCLFTNTSDVDMYISIDGVTNNIRISAGGSVSYDTKTLQNIPDTSVYIFAEKVQLQVKLENALATATWGDVYCNLLSVQL